MATESTVKNIRAPQTVFDRLKTLTDEHFPNQGAALEALLNSWEIQAAKGAIPNRETDIADFDSHLQALSRAFVHSLEIAENADARARDAFRVKLEALEAEKADLRRKLEEAELQARSAKSKQENATASALDANARADAAERHAATLEKALEAEKTNAAAQIEDKERLAHSLTAQVADLSERARENAAAAAEVADLRKKLNAAKQELDAAAAAAQVAAAKADAEKALAVSEARDSTTTELLKAMMENSALKVEIERLKARITLLESPKEMRAAPMSDQQTPPPPEKDTSNIGMDKRRKTKAAASQRKKAAPKQGAEEKKEIPGLEKARSIIDAWDKYQTAFRASFEGDDAVGGMTDVSKPSVTVEEYLKDYPAAAAYLQAERESLKTNYELATIGKRALDAIAANPDDYATAIAQMKADLSAYSDAPHMWD